MVVGIGQAKKCEALAKTRKAGFDRKAESCLFVMNQSVLRMSRVTRWNSLRAFQGVLARTAGSLHAVSINRD